MRSKVRKIFFFLYQLLGISLWKITTSPTTTGKRIVTLSMIALTMSLTNFAAAVWCGLTISQHTFEEIRVSGYFKSSISLFGDMVITILGTARFFTIYLTVWIFFREQKELLKCFLAIDDRLGRIRDRQGSLTKEKQSNRQTLSRTLRFALLIITSWHVLINMFTWTIKGCSYAGITLADYKLVLFALIIVIGKFSALFNITGWLFAMEKRFIIVRLWLTRLGRGEAYALDMQA